ncbi:hypothetical protein BV25DRAFT_1913863 [Artomyces pyxidatus]|uniref:Uncharacterized protein n=1 Tax=Artomyces pyxidatus TaxID=48021 RepID=A0ACB8T9S0_9AGAM|nr:hypothetical protein BV25DRAFT_1913863 [Artomyces pyxidatus]
MSTPAPGPPDVRDTFGLIVVGTILGSLFYGMTLLQTGLYFGKFGQGTARPSLTVLVIVLCVFDSLSWVLEVYTTWYYFVANYAVPSALAIPLWALKLEPFFTYTVSFIAQMFFIEKIYLLSRSKLIGGILTLLSLTAWVLGLTIMAIVFADNVLNNPLMAKVNIGQKTLSTLIEVLVAAGMCYLFSSRQTGAKSTDSMLQRLIIFALSRGVVMSVIQICYTIVVFSYPNQLYWVIFHFMLGKLSCNSVLASLNVREIMRGGSYASSSGGHNSFALQSTGVPGRNGIVADSNQVGTRIVFRHDSNPGTTGDTKAYASHTVGPDLEGPASVQVDTEYYKQAD